MNYQRIYDAIIERAKNRKRAPLTQETKDKIRNSLLSRNLLKTEAANEQIYRGIG